jgi:peptidoglycan/LPS O-acetylase OafA/YrhL
MNVIYLLPVACLFAAFVTASCISKFHPINTVQNKYPSLDGLRGYLAFFVFLNHALIWFEFVDTNQWSAHSVAAFRHFGKTSVSLFFMITAFLFWSKLLSKKPIIWNKFYLSRVYRLVPLYLFMLIMVCAIVVYQSGFKLREPIPRIGIEMGKWGLFGILGAPPINGYKDSYAIIAKVLWSLHYEWLFYLSLPLCSLLLKKRPSNIVLLLSFLAICFIGYQLRGGLFHLYPFAGGIAAAYLVNNKLLRSLASTVLGSVFCLLSVILAEATSAFSEFLYLAFLSFGFILLVCGNTLFGVLKLKASHILGQMSYSLYLLHGIGLFVVFRMIQIPNLDTNKFFLAILCLTPVVILFCHFTYVLIEKPFMNLGHHSKGIPVSAGNGSSVQVLVLSGEKSKDQSII